MDRIKEVIVVEGRYDRNTLSQVVDAVIIETAGFGIFSDREKMELLRRMALKRGLIILTDSDGAGFMIRNHIKGGIPQEYIKHAYIPEIAGKERRKNAPSKEGTLGVEGMKPETLLEALRRAGATFEGENGCTSEKTITKAELYSLGLFGGADSVRKRRELLKAMGLPEKLSSNAMLDVLNALITVEELKKLCGG